MKKKIYFENLDGLRFLCVLCVFFFHSFHTEFDHIKNDTLYFIIKREVFGNGNLGVNFFFVLSGFLITYLLIEEKKMNGQIDLKKFWLRRILRIWPLFYFCVFFGFVMFPYLKTLFGQVPNETASLAYYLLFLNNFDFIHKGLPDASILGVLWSVAIEEQFYFVWPIALYLLPIKRYWIAFSAVIASSLIFRACNDSFVLHEYSTFSCIGDMAVGALGAWLVIQKPQFKNRLEELKKYQILFIYSLFVFIFFFRDEILYSYYPIRIIERVLVALVLLLIILEQNYAKRSFFKMSRFERFSKLGNISYGIYCLHFIGILIATHLTKLLHLNTKLWQVLLIDTSLALSISILISLLSYQFYEKPFLKIKDKISYIRRK